MKDKRKEVSYEKNNALGHFIDNRPLYNRHAP